MNNKLIYLAIIILISMTFISAETGNIPQNKNFSITQNCPTSTYSNLTKIQLMPYTNITMQGQFAMTKNGDNYNITIDKSNSSVLGTLWIYGICDQNGTYTPWQYSLLITPNGYNASTGQTIIMLIGLGLLLLTTIVIFYFGYHMENITIKVFAIGFSAILLIFSMGYGLTVLNNTVAEFSGVTSVINVIYILGVALLGVGGIGIIIWLIAASMTMFSKYRGFKD